MAMLAACLVYFSLLLAAFTGYVWLMLGGDSLYEAVIAAIKLLCGFVLALAITACVKAALRGLEA
ncbi:hypothetical protein [Stenotrophomonas maltophilia]|uniref:hypothetical protein n=1 Tax=Stenotrophomonas maltophilia TaxID=40324 RepID=UPI0011B5C6F7|nr:hypothetical protein [Stenotrophomonas maltophilia]